MGDRFRLSPHADAQPNRIPAPLSFPPSTTHQNHFHEFTNVEEDDGEIKCVCGYTDDDGSTVLCEKCNTWQHVECYYFPTRVVPDVHQCVDCLPRFIDSTGATLRQQQLREAVVTNDERRPKRPGPKGSRKVKAKDLSNGTAQPNGVPHAQVDQQNGGWEQPPAKRAKTTHRTSNSQALHSNGRVASQRNRSGSNTASAIIKVKPPLAQCPPDYFSPEFIRVHQFTEGFRPAQGNAHLNIGITDLLSRWLDDPEEFAVATNDKKHSQVFKHYDQPIEQLQMPIQKQSRQDTSCVFHGKHPVWPYLTVDQDLYEGDFVGEVFGTIGHIEDYKRDPDNQWDRLRHPDHFVFFHPHLPIYIDCRTEGTILRHARRSCDPNLTMETLITGARDYHFCLTALKDIPKGTEITIRWDMHSDPQLWQCLEHLSLGPLDDEEKGYIQDWVGTVLAHFGGCACSGAQCALDRFDYRAPRIPVEVPTPAVKSAKRKRAPRKSPPSNLHVRGGVDNIQQYDNVEDMDDSRSVSQSNRSQTSREATPAGYGAKRKAADEGLSQRDRKKLQQEERLFAKQEHEQQHGKRASKKRISGSNSHTPAAAASTQFGRSASASSPNTPAPGSKIRSIHNGTSYFDTPPISQRSSVSRASQRRPGSSGSPSMMSPTSKPIYVDAETQTEPIDDDDATSPHRKQYLTLAQRLLKRHRSRLIDRTNLSIKQSDETVDQPETSIPDPLKDTLTEVKAPPASPEPKENMEVEMQDVEPEPTALAEPKVQAASSTEPIAPPSKVTKRSPEPPNPPISPAAPRWSDPNAHSPPLPQRRAHTRGTNMHVDLPPPAFQAPVPIMSSSPTPGAPTATMVESPKQATPFMPQIATMSPAPLNSQQLPTFAHPSPVKKRISLSDYMKKKGSTPGIEKSQAQSLQDRGSSSPTLAKAPSPGKPSEDEGPQPDAAGIGH